MDKTPFFSIVTVTFNSEQTLNQTIDSLLDQECDDFEYILVDGNSSDSTISIIKSYEEKFSQRGIPFYWISEEDDGIYDAMNKGLKKASGEFIGIINSDDWYEKDSLKIIKEEYNKSHSDLLHGNLNLFNEKKEFLKVLKPSGPRSAIRKMPFLHPTCFVKKNVYQALKGYRLDYQICSDYDFVLRVLKKGFSIKYIDTTLANFTMGGVSTTMVDKSLKESHRIRVRNGYNAFLSKFYFYLETIICKIKY